MKRPVAIAIALFVTVLWSTSYILNKWAFAEGIGPVTLAGLRYTLAALALWLARLLWPPAARPNQAPEGRVTGWQYLGLGLAGYLLAQGLHYSGQYWLTPTQAGLTLAVGNTALVLALGFAVLGERPSRRQWLGMGMAMAGISLYSAPFRLSPENWVGIGLLLLSAVGYAVQLIANRRLLARQAATPIDLVLYPMAVGAAGMLLLGIMLEGVPALNVKVIWILLWLGPVNAALGFVLWTYSQKGLQAFESSTINNTMMLQIALLDMLLLGRVLEGRHWLALLLTGAGILAVQTARRSQ